MIGNKENDNKKMMRPQDYINENNRMKKKIEKKSKGKRTKIKNRTESTEPKTMKKKKKQARGREGIYLLLPLLMVN